MPAHKQSICKSGHPLAGDNLYSYHGGKACKTCRVEATRRWRRGEAIPMGLRIVSKNKLSYSRTYEGSHKSHRMFLKKARKRRIRTWYRAYKQTLACVRCGESHPACLTFHHTNPEEKHSDVTKMVQNGMNESSILKEIKKCLVLCANCHAKEHWKDE